MEILLVILAVLLLVLGVYRLFSKRGAEDILVSLIFIALSVYAFLSSEITG